MLAPEDLTLSPESRRWCFQLGATQVRNPFQQRTPHFAAFEAARRLTWRDGDVQVTKREVSV